MGRFFWRKQSHLRPFAIPASYLLFALRLLASPPGVLIAELAALRVFPIRKSFSSSGAKWHMAGVASFDPIDVLFCPSACK